MNQFFTDPLLLDTNATSAVASSMSCMECPSCGCAEACSCHCHDGKRPIDFLAAGIQGVPQFSKRERSLIRQALDIAAREQYTYMESGSPEYRGAQEKKAAKFRELKRRFREGKNG
jgi:hypothetical protein